MSDPLLEPLGLLGFSRFTLSKTGHLWRDAALQTIRSSLITTATPSINVDKGGAEDYARCYT